jgi:hypothetical protein
LCNLPAFLNIHVLSCDALRQVSLNSFLLINLSVI